MAVTNEALKNMKIGMELNHKYQFIWNFVYKTTRDLETSSLQGEAIIRELFTHLYH
jgi:hypothetical protein